LPTVVGAAQFAFAQRTFREFGMSVKAPVKQC
jgi:hypothetical protein